VANEGEFSRKFLEFSGGPAEPGRLYRQCGKKQTVLGAGFARNPKEVSRNQPESSHFAARRLCSLVFQTSQRSIWQSIAVPALQRPVWLTSR